MEILACIEADLLLKKLIHLDKNIVKVNDKQLEVKASPSNVRSSRLTGKTCMTSPHKPSTAQGNGKAPSR